MYCVIKLIISRLGIFYNSAMGHDNREMVQEWARRLFPDVWTEVAFLGKVQHEDGYYLMKMPKRIFTA